MGPFCMSMHVACQTTHTKSDAAENDFIANKKKANQLSFHFHTRLYFWDFIFGKKSKVKETRKQFKVNAAIDKYTWTGTIHSSSAE